MYETRLLPGLIWQNEEATKKGELIEININFNVYSKLYSLSSLSSKDNYEDVFCEVVKRILETHALVLDMVHCVNILGGSSFSGQSIKTLNRGKDFNKTTQELPFSDGHCKILKVEIRKCQLFSYPTDDEIFSDSRNINYHGISELCTNRYKISPKSTSCLLTKKKRASLDFFENVIKQKIGECVGISNQSDEHNLKSKNNPHFKLQILSAIIALAGSAAIILAFTLLHAAAPSVAGVVVACVGAAVLSAGCYGLFKKSKEQEDSSYYLDMDFKNR